MKTQTNIWILGIFLALNACQPYSADDINYFETAVPYLSKGVLHMEAQSQTILRQIERSATKRKDTNHRRIVKNAHELFKTTYKTYDYLDIYKVFQVSEYDFYENEETTYLKSNPSNIYFRNQKITKVDSIIKKYIHFIEYKYPKLMTQKLKSWKKEGKGFLRRQCENLPLIGALASLLDLKIEMLNQGNIILNDLLTKSRGIDPKYRHTEHLQFVFSEEKNTVKLGEEYKAQLSLEIAYQMPNMIMEINGQKIPIKNGVGKLRFKAQELGKKYWTGKTTFKDQTGKDTTFRTEKMMYEVIPKQE